MCKSSSRRSKPPASAKRSASWPLVTERTEPIRELQRARCGIQAASELSQSRLRHQLNQYVPTLHPLVEGGRSNPDAMGDGLHGQTCQPIFFEEVARGKHDRVEGGSVRSWHGSSIAIDDSHDGYV